MFLKSQKNVRKYWINFIVQLEIAIEHSTKWIDYWFPIWFAIILTWLDFIVICTWEFKEFFSYRFKVLFILFLRFLLVLCRHFVGSCSRIANKLLINVQTKPTCWPKNKYISFNCIQTWAVLWDFGDCEFFLKKF